LRRLSSNKEWLDAHTVFLIREPPRAIQTAPDRLAPNWGCFIGH
jgi:hypothetical protein